jgi:ketosteroid isomerase-like protein
MSASGADPASVAVRFNECINGRDIDGLSSLMSDDHRFIDSADEVISGKEGCLHAWQGFFESFPDYRNVFTSVTARDEVVVIAGHSECSVPSLRGPALWTATIRAGTVTEWRVYDDTPENRRRLAVRGR